MKKAFTLIEMLIVVVVLVILMSIAFRLAAVGDDQENRAKTIARMQRLENCLSGYYAAYGSYPPVKVQGSRNIYLKTSGQGIANSDGQQGEELWSWTEIGETAESKAWNQVKAACMAQPVACEFPFAQDSSGHGRYRSLVYSVARECMKLAKSKKEKYRSYWDPESNYQKFTAGNPPFDDLVSGNIDRHTNLEEVDWKNIQLFRFGLMSYLVPRYLVMMNSNEKFYKSTCGQWCGNNTMPKNALTGDDFNDWNEVRDYVKNGEKNNSDYATVANIPSQAVCARWLPNLAGACNCNHETVIMGIDIYSGVPFNLSVNPNIHIYSPNNSSGSSFANQYVLDGITMCDGWNNDFYYYSPPPYQNYVLWSSGANGRTFPPWIDRKSLGSKANQCVAKWIEDDFTHLSN